MPFVKSFQELWHVTVGRSCIQRPDLVEVELNAKVKELSKLATQFKPFNSAAAKQKEKDKSAEVKFCLRLAKLLDLDYDQCNEILNQYKTNDYYGSNDQFKQLLSDERNITLLLVQVAEYYFSERLYLLRTVKHIICYFEDKDHPFCLQYEKIIKQLSKLGEALQSQYVKSFDAEPISYKNRGPDCSQEIACHFALQQLKEQCELLEVVMLYYSHYPMKLVVLKKLSSIFKDQQYGYRHSILEMKDMQVMLVTPLLQRLSSLQQLIMMQGFEMDYLQKYVQSDTLAQYQLYSDSATFEKIDSEIVSMVESTKCAMLLLAWATVRYNVKKDRSIEITQKIGDNAIRFNAWKDIANMLSSYPFNGHGNVASTTKTIIHSVQSCVLFSLDENSLGDYTDIVHANSLALQNPKTANQLWKHHDEQGSNLITSVSGLFPLARNPLMHVLHSLCCDATMATKILSYAENLPFITESIGSCDRDIIQNGQDDSQWQLISRRRMNFPGGYNVVMDAGTVGQLMDTHCGAVVRWEHKINAWELMLADVKRLVSCSSVSYEDLTQYILTYKIIDTIFSKISESKNKDDILSAVKILKPFVDFIPNLLLTLQPMNESQEFMACLLNCLTSYVKIDPSVGAVEQVLSALNHVRFLPQFDRKSEFKLSSLSNDKQKHEFARSCIIKHGLFGDWIEQVEKSIGHYAVTVSMIDLISNITVGAVNQTDQKSSGRIFETILPGILFVIREIFTYYLSWDHANIEMSQNIGLKSLELSHTLLRSYTVTESSKSNIAMTDVRIMILALLSDTQAAEVVVKSACVPMNTMHAMLSAEPTSIKVEAMMQTVQLSFSLLNNLLRVTSEQKNNQHQSHLTQLLSVNKTHTGENVISLIAAYLHHRHNVSLPRLAIILLRRFSLLVPMSLHASLGSYVDAVRDILLERIKSRIEDLPLKVAILEFLIVSVQTQPGLIELFLDLEPQDKDKPGKGLKLGPKSCLSAAFDLIHPDLQGTYELPADLHCACVKLLSSLWVDRRHSALQALKPYKSASKETLWNSLLYPLFSENSPREIAKSDLLETCAHIINVVSLENYYTPLQNRDTSFNDLMKEFASKGRYKHWSKVLVCVCRSLSIKPDINLEPSLMFVAAWRTFMATNKLKEPNLNEIIIDDVITSIECLMTQTSEAHSTCANLLSNLLLLLIQQCAKSITIASIKKSFKRILTCLDDRVNREDTVDRLQVHMHCSLLHFIPLLNKHVKDMHPDIIKLLRVTCTNLQTIIFSLQKEGGLRDKIKTSSILLQTVSDIFKLSNMNTDLLPEWRKILVGEATFNLLCSVLIRLINDSYVVTDKSSMQAALARSILLLFCRVAEDRHVAMTILHTGVMEEFCLKSASLYAGAEDGNKKYWVDVYVLCLSFMERMLRTLSYEFLTHMIDFVSVHHDRFVQCLRSVQMQQSESVLREASYTTAIFSCLSSKFVREWRFNAQQSYVVSMERSGLLLHSCTAILLRPQLLHKAIELSSKKDPHDKFVPTQTNATVSKQMSLGGRSVSLQEQEPSTPQYMSIQQSFMAIIANTIATLKHVSPNLTQMLFDLGMDLNDYQPVLAVGFAAPSLDHVVQPSFGTVLNATNVAQRILKNDKISQAMHDMATYVHDASLVLCISQCLLILRKPSVSNRDKNRLRREFGDELSSLLRISGRTHRHSSSGTSLTSPQTSPVKAARLSSSDQPISGMLDLVHLFLKQVLR